MTEQRIVKHGSTRRDPFQLLQDATRLHRREHGCQAYTFEDGLGLMDLAARFKPKRVLELGTALGYTSCCLASGSPDAHVDTIERDPLHVELARCNIAAANLASRITVHEGAFANILSFLAPDYDFVFFDGFAPDVSTLTSVTDLLAPDGVLVLANLSLAPPPETQRIMSALKNLDAWRRVSAIESGATTVWRRGFALGLAASKSSL